MSPEYKDRLDCCRSGGALLMNPYSFRAQPGKAREWHRGFAAAMDAQQPFFNRRRGNQHRWKNA
jgi:hypothetical protein